ncbi:xanthine dehydrogenase accessory protein XdhC [Caulobacter sp. SLTY]|uniref:xanthine dehydrogenase accessory protein XdhC n=1 Tax=Caulobacter sp. SLTY TaxID=2683262 RepID=UPI0014124B98|nr:xanthine dehydrogenase accessory protein XdhC [Caulobacter sp. SLTY]NBB14362.1 xanthine dehydrogenase accessory protein XdhC [Caulobacter sp. SLTY]
MSWAAQALSAIRRGEPLALVTVIAAEGSTPREAGTRMLVTADGQTGTIGGGALEYRAADQARQLLGQSERDWAVQDYPLGPFLQQCCGGHVRLLLERLDADDRVWLEPAARAEAAGRPYGLKARICGARLERGFFGEETQWVGAVALIGPDGVPLPGRRPTLGEGDALVERIDAARPRVLLFGAGHVGQAIARALTPLPFRLDWQDSRQEAAGPGVAIHEEARLIETAAGAGPDDLVLILTHNHDLDYQLTRAALSAAPAYVGLIGSATKKARFLRRLNEDGVSAANLTCPIGIEGLKSKAPEVIAVSVAAQLLQRMEA